MLQQKIPNHVFIESTRVLYERVMRALEKLDPDDAEAFFHLDNITITFSDHTRFVINRQPPTQQVWLATKDRGLHFDYFPEQDLWITKKTNEEFYSVLKQSIEKFTKAPVEF